jgi:predicted RNA polymerase sigma factor
MIADRLRLIFTCCHPALDVQAQVALTLRTIGGLTAAAVGFARGPGFGLELPGPLLTDPALERYQPLHAAHAELLRQAGDHAAAARAYRQAIALSTNEVARAELRRRLAGLSV